MSQQTENLIESDHIEEVLDETGPLPPVVVVQYRNRVIPWILVIALMGTTATLAGMLARHRREVDRLSQQVLEARSDLERLKERSRAESDAARLAEADRPGSVELAMARSPQAADPVAGPAGAGTSATPAAADPSPSAKSQAPRSAAAQNAPPSPTPDPTPATIQVAAKPDPAKPSGTSPTAPSDVPPPPTAPRHRVVTLAAIPEGPSPFDETPGDGGQGQVPGQPGPVVLPAEPPLPSREEAERQIREQAARMQQENNQRQAQQQEDLQSLRDDERRQFLNELRLTLQVHGRRAGPEIEELYVRAGRDEDPVKLKQAYQVIGSGRQSQRMKVYHLREIGVSESVILDYLANELNKDLGSRNGPRSRNDVWVQAARLLLNYELPPPRPADAPAAAVRPADRPAAAPRPAGDTRRAP